MEDVVISIHFIYAICDCDASIQRFRRTNDLQTKLLFVCTYVEIGMEICLNYKFNLVKFMSIKQSK